MIRREDVTPDISKALARLREVAAAGAIGVYAQIAADLNKLDNAGVFTEIDERNGYASPEEILSSRSTSSPAGSRRTPSRHRGAREGRGRYSETGRYPLDGAVVPVKVRLQETRPPHAAPPTEERTMNERIEWTRSTGLGQSGWKGRVNGLPLFGIECSVERGTGWQLRTSLPVALTRAVSTGADADALMANAEQMLDRFVRKLGASWPDDRTEEV